ncbi:MAG: primosomal protein N' [Firmicutes bacterium]|nr:primosomal protein N' [Bacillota bacterium]
MKYALVVISIAVRALDRVFSYKIPDDMRGVLRVGMRVNVPFGMGNRVIEGYVIALSDTVDIPEEKLKPIAAILENYPVISQKRIELAYWMQKEYYSTLSECMQCIIPKKIKSKTYKCVFIDRENTDNETIDKIIQKNNKQSSVLKFLINGDSVPVSHIGALLGVGTAPINALIKKGILKTEENEIYRGNYNAARVLKNSPFELNDGQRAAVDAILSDDIRPVLLKGVTGSGKTEVYLRVIEKTIEQGKQAIVLVPEISLTPQTVDRFVSRFGGAVAVTHSKMSDGERYDQWRRARSNEISVMIGPRSAIFTPFEDLGVIIIDEEHESAYKADTYSPKYDAREVALELSRLYGCRLVLGSATPSVTSYNFAQLGVYRLCEMKERINLMPPEIILTDMREELASGNRSIFGRELFEAVKQNLEEKKQTILFLNRRGHSTFVSCRECGYVMTCAQCSVSYTYHKYTNSLMCHYCGKEISSPEVCPQCGSKHIRYFGTGTQKIEQETQRLFPSARILRMDSDTTSGKNSHGDILDIFRNGGADILVGTQMIAKGLDFPNVTLVGVMAADLSLNTNDYHSGEVTYQLITQVAGRAGRAEYPGRVFVQTYTPEHYSIKAAVSGDYEGFYKQETAFRKMMKYPPFSNMFFILVSGGDDAGVYRSIMTLYEIMQRYNKKAAFTLYEPTPAIISKISGKYRWRMVVKSDESEKIKSYVLYTVAKLREYMQLDDISISISLNPNYSF